MGCCITKNQIQQKDFHHFNSRIDKNMGNETQNQEKNKLFQIPKNPILQRRLSQKKENFVTKQTYSYSERNKDTSRNNEYL
ncbi:unnamed protein product [Paramecium sonneborni]|uniref:Uncharacterized protein n=1 Tax=Paramecium sonneborni TaxID=65129 RepID=A0A8S1NY39_9CILI|nr:unnamed protein product [Paramecium sonneborni]